MLLQRSSIKGGPCMKQLITAGALLLAGICCPAAGYADDMVIPITMSAPEHRTVYVITGKVAAVYCADPAKGRRSEMRIENDRGQSDTLLVKATTTIYDPTGRAITLDTIKKNENVKVKYITGIEGGYEALSIRLFK